MRLSVPWLAALLRVTFQRDGTLSFGWENCTWRAVKTGYPHQQSESHLQDWQSWSPRRLALTGCNCPDPCVRWLQIKILNSIITSILPGLALTIFLAVLPMLLTLLNRHIQKMISETQIDFGVVRKYFAFQVSTDRYPGLLALDGLFNPHWSRALPLKRCMALLA